MGKINFCEVEKFGICMAKKNKMLRGDLRMKVFLYVAGNDVCAYTLKDYRIKMMINKIVLFTFLSFFLSSAQNSLGSAKFSLLRCSKENNNSLESFWVFFWEDMKILYIKAFKTIMMQTDECYSRHPRWSFFNLRRMK